MLQLHVTNAVAMEALGYKLAGVCPLGSKLFMQGELGTGKTTLSKGFLNGCGYQGIVKSPTYTLVEAYRFDSLEVYHFDLYRINNPNELDAIGIRDYFSKGSICLVEWPEKGATFLGTPDIHIHILYQGMHRNVHLVAKTPSGEKIIHCLLNHQKT